MTRWRAASWAPCRPTWPGSCGQGDRADYPAGTIVYQPRADPRAVLVVSGLVRVYLVSPEGRQVTVRYARPADVLGIAVLVRRAGLSYGGELLARRQLPGVGGRRELADSTSKVLALADQLPGLVVLPAHDPTAAQRLLAS